MLGREGRLRRASVVFSMHFYENATLEVRKSDRDCIGGRQSLEYPEAVGISVGMG